MSKAPDSPARSRSRSRSKSRSYSRSHSRSRSRSRSRKRRYSSRSRSRSRSHSPSYRNYPSRDYQNNRGGFRGYNRGFRRPYHYRARNRGYYPRSHYQNRGGGGYGYKSNWQGGVGGGGGGGWHDRHHDQDHHAHSPRRGRSRSRTPKKRSGSRSRSHYSDRSSSRGSRRSKHSSYSSRSRSSSPHHRSSKGKPGSKDAKDKLESQGEKSGLAADGSAIEKASGGKWIDYDASPKRISPDIKKEGGPTGPDSKAPATGGPMWKTIGTVSPPAKSPTKSGQTASFSGFGFFSKEEAKCEDKTVISAAFKKFLAENKNKKQAAEKENGRDKEQSTTDRELEKGGKSGDLFNISSTSLSDSKEDKTLPFFDAGEEEFLKSHGLKERDIDEDGEVKTTLTARDIFGKWGDEPSYSTSYPSVKEKSRRDAEEAEPLEHMEEEFYRGRKHSSKKEEKSKKKEKKDKEKSRRSLSPPATSREKERPLFPGAFPRREESPVRHLSASRDDFEHKIGSVGEMPSSSLSKERLVPRELQNPTKKDPEFRSIFQHVQSPQLRRSPSELFAQHIVSIVHYIKAQHFQSSDMTLSERFAMYQRKAAEVEMMKPRKSPEIHRRIDVSPSAFKRHSHLFEDMEETSYKDPSKKFKGDVMDLRLDIERRKRFAGKDSKREGGRSPGGSRGASREKSSEKSGKHHKKSKKGKKKRERSPSSSSSSSSPSPYPPPYRGKEFMGGEGMEHSEEGYGRYPPRDYSGPGDRGHYEGHSAERGRGRGFFPRVRGRGWSRGNYPGNNNNNNSSSSNGNPANVNPAVRPPEEEWDPEYTPKSRKYYLHDDRDGEKTWVDSRGRGRGSFPPRRGRFVYRKGGSSPKWTHDMFQGGQEGELGDDSAEVERKDTKGPGDASAQKQ
ncbi:thyroid hormone receptor-associated protein 3b [Anarrhichthys ocellatus]|uniref:thyroid hormone receptor-associated protein 3b n=1 Tax=Anarrhichthys ocellatus TaxID=433405 RepID=UPI0012ED5BC0|nr:thyroid hormone receptor-associated protein 3 [Anarrhichthys ocellatus]